MQNRKKARKYIKHVGDILLLTLSFLASDFLAKRHAGIAAGFFRLGAWEIYLLVFFGLIWNFGAMIFGLYDDLRNRFLRMELSSLGENIMLQAFFAVLVLFFAKEQTLSRFFVFFFYVFLLLSLVLWKIALYQYFSWQRKNGRNFSQILIVGCGDVARSFAKTIANNAYLGYRIKGFVGEGAPPEIADLYLGPIDQLSQVLERERVDEVVIALPNTATARIGRIIATCENFPVQVRIIPDYFNFMSPRFGISRFGGFPLISIRANPLEQLHYRLIKRGFDLVFTLLAFAAVFSWLWPLLALLIKIDSPGPVFFKQERWGKKNARIVCYKFRSMVKESRDVDENGHYQQATLHDPRVTRFGGFLRRSNLDELPQFINVLKGEMSIVGPRPHPTPMNLEVKDAVRHYQLRHLIQPGITGWAQVNGFRGETSDPELLRQRVESDIWYIENWSLLLDIRIVWLSVRLMFKGDPRAY